MPTTIPLHVFVRCLKSAKEFDRKHSEFDQVGWMLGEHWSFDDDTAYFPGIHVSCAASAKYEPV
jgi:hypothetical protein